MNRKDAKDAKKDKRKETTGRTGNTGKTILAFYKVNVGARRAVPMIIES